MLVRASHDASRRAYGRPRIWKDLVEEGERGQREARRAADARGGPAWPGRVAGSSSTTMSDHDQPVAANVLDRQFTADAPNQRWVGDTTEFLVGSSAQALRRRDPRSLLAVRRRLGGERGQRPASDDQGARDGDQAPLSRGRACCTTPTRAARTRARTTSAGSTTHGITCSMSRRGNCYDNAVMESFFSTVKFELGERFESCGEAKMAVVRLHRGVL